MINKKILMFGLGIVGMLSTSVMADGLTLVSKGIDSPIKVTCNGITLSYEMKPNSTINNIPWFLVSGAFHSQTLQCTFVLDNDKQDKIGTAELDLNVLGDQGEAKNVQNLSKYNVTISPAQNDYFKDLSVTIANN